MNIRESDHIAADLGIPTWTQNRRPSANNQRQRLSIQVMRGENFGLAGRETLRGIGRKHGSLSRRAAAITTAEVRKLCSACGPDLAGARDRAMFLLGFAGALRRSELIGVDLAHVTWTKNGLRLLIERSKTDTQGEGAEIAIPRGHADDTCPVTALKT
jgi:integrase